jgi:hypothetical protein
MMAKAHGELQNQFPFVIHGVGNHLTSMGLLESPHVALICKHDNDVLAWQGRSFGL